MKKYLFFDKNGSQYRIKANLTGNNPEEIISVLLEMNYKLFGYNINQKNPTRNRYLLRKKEVKGYECNNYHLQVFFKKDKSGRYTVSIGQHEDIFYPKKPQKRFISNKHESLNTPQVKANLLEIEKSLKNRELIQGEVDRFFGQKYLKEQFDKNLIKEFSQSLGIRQLSYKENSSS